MDRIVFVVRRTHLRTVAVGREWLKGIEDLTPARLDILELISETAHRQVAQSELRRALGVARSTLSEAVQRLVELGLITRHKLPRDTRTHLLRLTSEARARLERVFAKRKKEPMARLFRQAFGERSRATAGKVTALRLRLGRVARFFGDTAQAFELIKTWHEQWPWNAERSDAKETLRQERELRWRRREERRRERESRSAAMAAPTV